MWAKYTAAVYCKRRPSQGKSDRKKKKKNHVDASNFAQDPLLLTPSDY